jgi:hypothetical protein
MQALTVDINHLKSGVRYKFIKNTGNIYSGVYKRTYIVEGGGEDGNATQEHMLVFENVVDETTGIEQGEMHILSDFIIEIYAVVSAPSGKLPADIGREISNYGGKRKTKNRNKSKKQKLIKSKGKSKSGSRTQNRKGKSKSRSRKQKR